MSSAGWGQRRQGRAGPAGWEGAHLLVLVEALEVVHLEGLAAPQHVPLARLSCHTTAAAQVRAAEGARRHETGGHHDWQRDRRGSWMRAQEWGVHTGSLEATRRRRHAPGTRRQPASLKAAFTELFPAGTICNNG
jgi:hypothetical protein